MSVDVSHGSASPLPVASALGERIAAACTGWRGTALAALVVLVSALPGLLALPPLDRDESRFAQATVQMLETGDHVNIRFQQEPRDRKPVGVYWLQAVSVQLLSSVEARDIRPYRLPSLLGAMLAAAACAWAAGAAFGPRGGTLAGGMLGAGLLLSSEAFVGKTDAVLCGTVTLAMAALGRLYLAERSGLVRTGRWEKLAFWFGLASAILDKGPVGPMVVGLAVFALVVADRRAAWLRDLGWGWGLLMLLLIVGPWAFSITVATDGGFWGGMAGGDIGPKMRGGHEGHWGLPGEHAFLSPLLTFPTGFLLPAALVAGWTRREEPGVRFALAWLVPAWIVFELLPTKLVHYPLPLYGSLAWMAAAAVTGDRPIGPWSRRIGAGLGMAVAVGLAVVAIVGAVRYGAGVGGTLPLAIVVAILTLAAGALGAWSLLRARPMRAVAIASLLGVAAHMAVTGLLLPRLSALWVSDRAAALLDGAGLDPRDGRTVGPVAVAGYAEPSLVFALGTDTELDGTGADAAEAVAAGSPAFVEQRQDKDFRDAVAKRGAVARVAGVISGFDYSTGRDVRLTLWKPTLLPPPSPDGPTASELEDAAASAANVTAATPPSADTRGDPRQEPTAMSRIIDIVEVGARDGLQNEAVSLSVEDKLAFIDRLEKAGVKRLEAVSFVNPKRVPQMAGAEEIMAALPRTPGRSRIGLVLNLKGWERCVAAGCDEANVVVCATDGFGRANQGSGTEEQMDVLRQIVARAKDEGPPVSATISVAFGCPFDGEVPQERVVRLYKEIADLGVGEIALADTIGVADPWTVRRRVEAVKAAAPDARLRLHFHDTRRTGLANAYAGLEAGADVLDASCGGIGGCPFAPNATGNIATEDLVYMLERAGFDTGLDLDALIETAHWIAAKLGKPAPSALSRAGRFPKARG